MCRLKVFIKHDKKSFDDDIYNIHIYNFSNNNVINTILYNYLVTYSSVWAKHT